MLCSCYNSVEEVLTSQLKAFDHTHG